MADRRLAAVGGVLFCGLVLMLLLILYYPDTSDDDSDDLWTPKISIKSWNNVDVEYITEQPDPESRIAKVARIIEDMGASFLALLAVLCVAAGLACLTCACCCAA